ncbi:MAG TPA: SDR family oxidoreductase [Roseiarcus sp.]|jgi:meso-butanediol dehydrogenase/(S,S)-butanediol dehydrogenase/diacetyl reductase
MSALSDKALEGSVVAVTGAARGIGAGIVEAALAAGARVALIDRDEATARKTARRLDSSGKRALAFSADVTNPVSLALAAEAAVQLGAIRGWVNNAGVVQMIAAGDLAPEAWRREFEVNVGGVVNGAQAARLAFAGKGGAIVNIASNAGKVGFSNMAAYNASKAAVINLTRSLAREWAPERINVNAVCPGSVATPMLRDVADRLAKETGRTSDELFAGMVPAQLGRHIEPIEIGRIVVFLLTDAAEIIRGQSINLDGGDTPY